MGDMRGAALGEGLGGVFEEANQIWGSKVGAMAVLKGFGGCEVEC